MAGLRIPIVLKYLVGIILVQGMTALLLYAWSRTTSMDTALTFIALGLAAALVAALWFATLAGSDRKEALMRAEVHRARERERVRRQSDRQRHRAVAQARKQSQRELGLARTRANLKIGAGAVGMAGLGVVLLLTQFLSLGVLLVSSSGGAVAGYLWRVRQETRRRLGNAGEDAREVPAAPRLVQDGRATAKPGR